MFRPSVLGLALALSSTALWSAFVTASMSVTTALIRFLIAVPVAALMLLLLRAVVAGYHTLPSLEAAGVAADATAEPVDGQRLGQPTH
ncbi:MAG: hypothetical protein ACR2N4_01145 [Jatrophihabitans sp.]